jgi:predicted phage tail protein
MTTITIGDIGQKINLLISRGDDFGPHEVTLTDALGAPFNLTGCSVVGALKKRANQPAPAMLFTTEITSILGGQFTFSMPKAETLKAAQPGTDSEIISYFWDLKLEFADGKRLPLFYGTATVKANIA